MKRIAALLLIPACLLSGLTGCARAGERQEGDALPLSYTIAESKYPEMAPYPNEADYRNAQTGEFDDESFSAAYDAWRASRMAQMDQPEGYADGLESFYTATVRQFLTGAGDQNRIYSPLNVYMALGMLAELTGGGSRQQILDLLGSQSIEALRAQADALWNANYSDNGAVTSILASSLWLNQNVTFKQGAMDTLARVYHASSFQGEMGTPDFNGALQSWLNQQTGGLLADQAANVELKPDDVLALAATLYFRAKWSQEFSPTATEEGVFHAADGDVDCDFMHQSGSRTYYRGDQFSAVQQSLEGSGGMWLILPDEAVSLDALLAGDQVMDLLFSGEEWKDSKFLTVNLSMPKFDVVSDLDLVGGLKALGVTDVFDAAASDFSPMTEDVDQIYVSKASHAARVTVDEEGCTAAAYTVMAMTGAGMPPAEEVDFVLDRPFLFVITGQDGAPLFAGVVNQPEMGQ